MPAPTPDAARSTVSQHWMSRRTATSCDSCVHLSNRARWFTCTNQPGELNHDHVEYRAADTQTDQRKPGADLHERHAGCTRVWIFRCRRCRAEKNRNTVRLYQCAGESLYPRTSAIDLALADIPASVRQGRVDWRQRHRCGNGDGWIAAAAAR